MCSVKIIFFQDSNGSVPVLDWIKGLNKKDKAKVIDRIILLSERGHTLRRPHADSIRGSDLYELRLRFKKVRVRILYFFFKGKSTVLCHVVSRKKTDKIPQVEINRALGKRGIFIKNPTKHSYGKEVLS